MQSESIRGVANDLLYLVNKIVKKNQAALEESKERDSL